MKSSAAVAVVGLVVAALACDDKRVPAHERTLFFRGEPAAQVEERVEDDGPGKRVQRRVRLPNGEIVETTARLDAFGFVFEATYRRGARILELRDGKLARDAASSSLALEGSVVPVDMVRHVQPAARTAVTLVDFASGELLAGHVERQGAAVVATDGKGGLVVRCNVEGLCTGPGAFFEGDTAPSLDIAPIEPALVVKGKPRALRLLGIADVLGALALDGPGQRAMGTGTGMLEYVDDVAQPFTAAPTEAERAPSLFIESDDPAVRAFAGKPGGALADAARIADAVFPLVDAAAKDQPPSATAMLAHRGDCDGAAALVTASLRALGHTARPVVGYRFIDAPAERAQTMTGAAESAGGRFVPHAWVEVYTPTGWVLIDATVPRVGGSTQGYVKLFHGLGSALTMGRVLGRLRVELAMPSSAAPSSSSTTKGL